LTGRTAAAPRDYAFLQMLYASVPWPGWRALRTRQYSYARTGAGPWLLFDIVKDPYQMNNLVDDPASKSLVEDMDKRLAAIMKDTGDSWDLKATTGDLENWLPGGAKQKSQNIGVPWPGGKTDAPSEKIPSAAKKKAAKRKKAKTAASNQGE